jgi:hypothetical protein
VHTILTFIEILVERREVHDGTVYVVGISQVDSHLEWIATSAYTEPSHKGETLAVKKGLDLGIHRLSVSGHEARHKCHVRRPTSKRSRRDGGSFSHRERTGEGRFPQLLKSLRP